MKGRFNCIADNRPYLFLRKPLFTSRTKLIVFTTLPATDFNKKRLAVIFIYFFYWVTLYAKCLFVCLSHKNQKLVERDKREEKPNCQAKNLLLLLLLYTFTEKLPETAPCRAKSITEKVIQYT